MTGKHEADHREPPPRVGTGFEGDPGEYLYRKGRLVVDTADVEEAGRRLGAARAKFAPRPDDVAERLGLSVLEVGERAKVEELVASVRGPDPKRQVRVAPEYAVSLASHMQWAPGHGAPRPAGQLGSIEEHHAPGAGITVGVVDTGAAEHGWYGSRVERDADDPATTDAHGDLSLEAGHGTFVAGVVLRHAPGARVVVRGAASEGGLADELAVARAILAMPNVDVLNLSLGTYGHGNQPPLAIMRALQALWDQQPDVVVVASAGNDRWDRPFWPAAAKRVVSVAALDAHGERAGFTNFGWWVDACAPGVDVHSTFLSWPGDAAGGSKGPFEGWALWDGTSFAAPHVSAAIACEAADPKDVPAAAFRRIGAPGLERKPGLGTVVRTPPIVQ